MASNEQFSKSGKVPMSSVLLNPPASGFAYSDAVVSPVLLPARSSNEGLTSPEELHENSEIQFEDVAYSEGANIGLLHGSADNPEIATLPQINSSKHNFHKPAQSHWFYSKKVEKKELWLPFSLLDSLHLEEVFLKGNHEEINVVATDGGRYDVYLQDRMRCAVYWEEESSVVRRATWFYRREGERAFLPYPEHFAEKLEEEYYIALNTNTWHRRLEFPKGETVVFHNPDVIVHYQNNGADRWEGSPEGLVKPSVVKRGMDDYEQVEDGDAIQIDHLVFVVHGIGAICDLKFRTLPEVVNDFRSISGTLLKTHFPAHVAEGKIGRVEFLPASWHTFLHGEATGIDEKLKPITLKSIPKLRYFANDAILDVLFYTSPFYCQAIINQVGSEINRLYSLFISRNPTFHGNVSLAGHSLGSVILFDILLHQEDLPQRQEGKFRATNPTWSTANTQVEMVEESDKNPVKSSHTSTLEDMLQHLNLNEYLDVFNKEKVDMDSLMLLNESDLKDMGMSLGPRKKLFTFLHTEREKKILGESLDRLTDMPRIETPSESMAGRRRKQSETTINYIVGLAGTGHPYVIYPRLNFKPTCFFALGSPIAMFLTVRGLDTDWKGFQFPNCPAFFNIFHPYDPVAYRIEPLVDPSVNLKPVLISHHKGRKRMHLEIKESLSRMGNDLKQKVFDSFLYSWNAINDYARIHRSSSTHEEMEGAIAAEEESGAQNAAVDVDSESSIEIHELREDDVAIGNLNKGRRIDYVLQEKPLESFNEYLFALGSHTCYWESEDTVLLILKEIYGSYGISPSFQYSEFSSKRSTT